MPGVHLFIVLLAQLRFARTPFAEPEHKGQSVAFLAQVLRDSMSDVDHCTCLAQHGVVVVNGHTQAFAVEIGVEVDYRLKLECLVGHSMAVAASPWRLGSRSVSVAEPVFGDT